MKIILTRKVNAQCFAAIATLEFMSEQKAYQNLLKLVPITSESIQKLFENKPESIRKRIADGLIKYFQDKKYITQTGELTKEGHAITETGKIKNEEMGKFVFWVVNDDFFGFKMIHFQRDPTTSNIRVQETDQLKKLEKNQFTSFVDNCDFLLEKFENVNQGQVSHIRLSKNDSELKFEITLDIDPKTKTVNNATYSLQGSLFLWNQLKISKNQESVGSFDLNRLMPTILPSDFKWDTNLWGGLTQFDSILKNHPNSVYSYYTNLVSDNKKIEGWGTFDTIVINNIPILPENEGEANKWLEFQIMELINKKYVIIKMLNKIHSEFVSQYSIKQYSQIQLDLPGLANKLFNNEQYEPYWHLQSSFDLL